ncbi:hypothetical protein NDN11_13885 [Acinetobacter sp. C26M]|uniref:hypothetical protein n=1 Tax=Acinetobacter sp. C26M TaxID=2950076 RepID=UPI0020369E0D|nr:hypothetical protein [Acinetobacter sp. C26M]USA45791.1 hypothetical protein NDN11_13885 [Acinetobacter sp. C26M]
MTVPGSGLSADADSTINVTVNVTGVGPISTNHSYVIDVTAPNPAGAVLNVNAVTADNVLNAAESGGNVTLTGTLTGIPSRCSDHSCDLGDQQCDVHSDS